LPDEVSHSAGGSGRHAIRPEKVRLDVLDGPAPPGHPNADATVAEVVYAGPVTRYLLDLAAGPRLVAVRQNDSRTDHEPSRGDRVRLWWRPENVISVATPQPSPTKESHA
jgi:putative spermidine/putrescine transport system ATP-binding protein